MISSSIICTLLFTMVFVVLIGSTHAALVHNKDDIDDSAMAKLFDNDQDDMSSSFKKQALEYNNVNPDEYYSLMFGKRQLVSRGGRLPSESILLGKRRLPSESILLGKRRLPAEAVLLGRRYLPNEAILLRKRR